MRPRIIAAILFLAFATVAFAQSQPANPTAVPAGTIRVTLLGTASGPRLRLIPTARRNYSSPRDLDEDWMTIEIAELYGGASIVYARGDGRQAAPVKCKEVRRGRAG